MITVMATVTEFPYHFLHVNLLFAPCPWLSAGHHGTRITLQFLNLERRDAGGCHLGSLMADSPVLTSSLGKWVKWWKLRNLACSKPLRDRADTVRRGELCTDI